MIGPMWFTPRGDLLELSHNGWQAAACVSYVFVGLVFLVLLAADRRLSREGYVPVWANDGRVNTPTDR